MIEREHLARAPEGPLKRPAGDPWDAHTSAWSLNDDWAQEVPLPDFSLFTEEQITDLLPQSLQDNFRLSQGYVQLIELARTVPSPMLDSMASTVRRGADELRSFDPDFCNAIRILAGALENCQAEEASLIECFHKLQQLHETFSAKDRDLFLATIQEITEACQPLAK